MPAPPTDPFALGDRQYLKEKVVATYERLWNDPDAISYKELFALKVNAAWLQSKVATATSAELFGVRKPAVRRLFAECCTRIDESHTADIQCHAMETLSGLFLGVGSRSFHDPVAEVLELLCGIEAADGVFGKLFGHLKRTLSADRRGADALSLRRTTVRLLLSLTAAASDLHTNILVDLFMPHGFETPVAALLQRGGATAEDASSPPSDRSGAAAASSPSSSLSGATRRRATDIEDVALLVVMLAAYKRHESPNAFLRLLKESGAEAAQTQALSQVSRRVLERCMYPSEGSSTASSYLGPSWGHSFARAADWAAHALTLEAYLPSSVTSMLSGPQALRSNAAPLTVALLIAHELTYQSGGALLAALCAQVDASTVGGGSGRGTRGALLRHVFSVASLLACDARDELLATQLRLSLLIIERALEGTGSAALILSAELGGGLPLWTFDSVHASESALASPQPLLAGGYTLIANLLKQNLRRALFNPPLYMQALGLLQKLLVAQHRAKQNLPLLRWPLVWEALFTTADFISQDDVFASRGVAEVGVRLLELINTFICLGDSLLPNVSTFESFAYELVRRHSTFEKLFRVSKRIAPRLVEVMSLARSMIVGALESIGRMDAAAATNLTAAQALEVIRGLNPKVKPETVHGLLKPQSSLSPHEQLALSHSLLRVLLAHCRRDGSLAPLHYEDLVSTPG
jgi:hypothetical protein